jgi:hypothetical protein
MEIETPETPNLAVLDGPRAIEALGEYINELETRRGEELTTRQTDAMIKLANALISSIEYHIQKSADAERLNMELQSNMEAEFSFTGRFRRAVANVLR